jgi:hypothetical protein
MLLSPRLLDLIEALARNIRRYRGGLTALDGD